MTIDSLSQKLENAGATALTIHARSGEKKFAQSPEYSIIKKVLQKITIPVVANGGVFTGKDAENILQQTGASAVMPGRGLIGNPWIIPEILSVFSKKAFIPPTLPEKKKICLRHLQKICEYYGERRGVLHMRKILPKYFSSITNLKNLKYDVLRATTRQDIIGLLEQIQNDGTTPSYRKR